MRELKFRVWNPDQSKLEYFDLHNITVSDNLLCQDKHPVQQFTGLQDSKGNDIYEGNIVKATDEEVLNNNFVGEVIFDEGSFCIHVEKNDTRGIWGDDDIEVIGNIYELPCNPDHNGECLVCDAWLSDCPFKI